MYQCTIKHVYGLSNSGYLNTSNWVEEFKGNEFVVKKDTGDIIGKTLTTINANKSVVINPGSDKNSFKAIAYFNNQVQVIEIQEFKKGKEKPFVASSMGGAGIVTGICK